MTESQNLSAFFYRGRTSDGVAISGTIDALNERDAARRLESLQLSVGELRATTRVSRSRMMGGDDFLAFNQQLAHLTSAAMPVEQGLRFISQEMKRGAMKRTVDLVVAELDSGKSLSQAVERHRDQFPRLYSRLIDAGIRAGNLSDVLLNLGRHLALMRRLQTAIWQTLSYPAVVMGVFLAVLWFILTFVTPEFEKIVLSFHADLPAISVAIITLSHVMSPWPVWAGIVVLLAGLLVVFQQILHRSTRGSAVSERIILRLPLAGAILRRSLICRWCDAVSLGVEAGMDLPASIQIASDAIGSAALSRDGEVMGEAISAGRSISATTDYRLLPATVIAAMDMAVERGDLRQTLVTMSAMYQQQAQLRLASFQAIVTPLLLVWIGGMVAVLMLAVLAPLFALLHWMGGS